jgi:hypothetical protein
VTEHKDVEITLTDCFKKEEKTQEKEGKLEEKDIQIRNAWSCSGLLILMHPDLETTVGFALCCADYFVIQTFPFPS